MDNKQTHDNKILTDEILKDSEPDSVAGGGHAGGTGVSCVPSFKSQSVPSNPTDTDSIRGINVGKSGPG